MINFQPCSMLTHTRIHKYTFVWHTHTHNVYDEFIVKFQCKCSCLFTGLNYSMYCIVKSIRSVHKKRFGWWEFTHRKRLWAEATITTTATTKDAVYLNHSTITMWWHFPSSNLDVENRLKCMGYVYFVIWMCLRFFEYIWVINFLLKWNLVTGTIASDQTRRYDTISYKIRTIFGAKHALSSSNSWKSNVVDTLEQCEYNFLHFIGLNYINRFTD